MSAAASLGVNTAAALAVEDRTPPPPPKEETPAAVLRDLAKGRPTKRDRRDITRLRGY